jgi:predicted helicase
VLINARCLTEGVDVPAIDGVAFVDPRSSCVDSVQAVGRELRTAPGKTVGTVLLPVYLSADDDPEPPCLPQPLRGTADKGDRWVHPA